MSREVDVALASLARSQRGVLTAPDLSGITGRSDEYQRRLRSGNWQEVAPGALAPAAVPVGPELLAVGASLGMPDSVLSHHDAARRSGMWVPDTPAVWVTVPFESPVRDVPGVRLVRSRAFPDEWMRDGPVRWTVPARTIVDLGMVLTAKQLEAVLLSGVRKSLVTANDVLAQADRLRGRKGVGSVRTIALLWSPERESMLEDRLFHDVRRVVGVEAVRQFRVAGRVGVVARVDVAVPELRLAFEADGLHFHSTDAQLAADQRRDRLLLSLGWQTVRFREGALDDSQHVRREIAAIVARRRSDLHVA